MRSALKTFRTFKTWLIVVGFSLACQGGLLHAEPMKLNEVSGNARWVVHVDCDAIRASTVVQRAHEKIK
ncbi:MAG: hypothetical protein U0903_17905 [Planctomycetales bacterium]